MAQEINIGSKAKFYRYSEFGKSIVEGKITGTNGEMVEIELDRKRYPNLPQKVKTHRTNLISDE